jgi:hypothetical protein
MPDITFAANGGEPRGYLAEPSPAQGPGVVVLQEWWGLDDHIRSATGWRRQGSSPSRRTSIARIRRPNPTKHSSG